MSTRDLRFTTHIDVLRVFIERGESAKFADRTQLAEVVKEMAKPRVARSAREQGQFKSE